MSKNTSKKNMSQEIDSNVDIDNKQITKIGIDSIIDFYHTMSIDELYLADMKAFVTGVNSSFLNVLFDLRLEKMHSGIDLIKAIYSFFEKHRVPWGWFVIPAASNDLITHGFKLIEESPSMYFNLQNPIPERKSNLITIKEVTNENDLKKWILPINEAFQVAENDVSFFELNARLLNKDEKKLRHFIAFYDNELAGSGTLFLSENAVMIHNVATKTYFKNRGIGTTLTLYMMEHAKQLGFKHCYLDSSSEAFNLYKKIGFKFYCTTMIYI